MEGSMAGHAALHFPEKYASFSFGLSEVKNMVVYYERTLIQDILKIQFVIVLSCSFSFFIVLKKVQEFQSSPTKTRQKRKILHNPRIVLYF